MEKKIHLACLRIWDEGFYLASEFDVRSFVYNYNLSRSDMHVHSLVFMCVHLLMHFYACLWICTCCMCGHFIGVWSVVGGVEEWSVLHIYRWCCDVGMHNSLMMINAWYTAPIRILMASLHLISLVVMLAAYLSARWFASSSTPSVSSFYT